MPIWFFFEKSVHESVVFLTKNVKNQKYNILSTPFFALFMIFFFKNIPLSYRFDLFWKKTGMRAFCFWRKMSKIKNKLYFRCLFVALFFFNFLSKNMPVSYPFDFFFNRQDVYFWWKMFKIKIQYNIDVFFFTILRYFPPTKRAQQPPYRNSQKKHEAFGTTRY